MAIGTPWVGTRVNGNVGNPTSATLDISGATDDDWVYVDLCLGDVQASAVSAPAGWTIIAQGGEGTTATASSRTLRYRRKKAAGDTTFIFTWPTGTKFTALPYSYPGLDATTPDEGAAYLAHTAANANVVSASITPTAGDRWIVMGAHVRSTSALRTFTPDAALVERSDGGDTGNPENAHELADSNGAVTASAHTYTAVASAPESHGGAIVMAIVPASGASTVNLSPAALALAAVAVGATPGMVTVDLAPAASTLTAVAVTSTPGMVTVNLTPATLTLSPVAQSATPGPVTVALTPAGLTLTAVPVTTTGSGVLALTPAGLTLTAVAITVTPGMVTVALTRATLTLTARPVTATPSPVTVNLSPATLTLAAAAVNPAPGAVTVALTPALLVLAAVAVSASSPPMTFTPRPSTGTTPRPAAGGITARPSLGVTLRPGAGVTARPDGGVTTRP